MKVLLHQKPENCKCKWIFKVFSFASGSCKVFVKTYIRISTFYWLVFNEIVSDVVMQYECDLLVDRNSIYFACWIQFMNLTMLYFWFNVKFNIHHCFWYMWEKYNELASCYESISSWNMPAGICRSAEGESTGFLSVGNYFLARYPFCLVWNSIQSTGKLTCSNKHPGYKY